VYRRIAVTGANGFIGRHLIRTLCAAQHEVVAVVRSDGVGQAVPDASTIRVIRDSHSTACWSDVVGGCHTVVHLIGLAHGPARKARLAMDGFRAVNVGITERVLAACLQARVSRLIYVSSIKAVGEGRPEPYAETAVCAPEDAYGVSKREAEILIQDRTSGEPIEAAIVRPPVVYGPEGTGNIARLIRLVATGLPLPTRCIEAKRSLAYVGNLVDAIRCLVEAEATAEGIFHVCDEEDPLTTRELLCETGRLMGKRVIELPVPVPVLRGIGRLVGMGGEVDRLTRSLTASTTRLKEEFGWEAPYARDEGLTQTIQWCLGHTRS